MISVQVPCTLDEAMLLLSARASMNGQSVEQVASAVVDGAIRFDEPFGGSGTHPRSG